MPEAKPLPASHAYRRDLPSLVADAIRTGILVGKLEPGDKLPTERELCEDHQVSRVVVREAIARLRHEGLVTSQQGRGVFVATPNSGRFLEISDDLLARPEDYRKLYELRLVLESGSAALAAQHRDDDDLAAIAGFLDDMRHVDELKTNYVAADIAFHRAIAAASKNPFMGMFASFVASKLQESIALALQTLDFTPTVKISIDEHEAILDGIRAGDAAAAGAAMRRHLENSGRRLGL